MNNPNSYFDNIIALITKLYSRSYKFLSSDIRYVLIFLFALSFVSRMPGIFILEIDEEPGRDGAFYYDIAKNINEGDGYVSDIKNRWWTNWEQDRGNTETISAFPPLYMYLL